MNDAVIKRPTTYAQIRIREPAGERTLDAALSVGGEGAQVVVPGAAAGVAVTLERHGSVWMAIPSGGAGVRFDARPLTGARDLRRGDVLAVGAAQLVVIGLSRTLLRLEVVHLAGNATIPPAAVAALAAEADGADELEIHAAPFTLPGASAAEGTSKATGGPIHRRGWLMAAAAALLLLAVLLLLSALEPVALDVRPADARVRTPGTTLALHLGDRMFVLPGRHTVRAEHAGYLPAEADVAVGGGAPATARLRLQKLPGRVRIDTGGVAAMVSIDGAEAGRAPGELQVAPGRHTVTLRAPRHLDFVARVDVAGGGALQELQARLQPAWGTLRITVEPADARVSVDGRGLGAVPAALEVDAGVRRVQLSAPGFRPWETSVVVKAGETVAIGPVRLGEPDARLTVRSNPAGAEVSVGGVFRGRTPVTLDVSPRTTHELLLTLPGHAAWRRSILAEPGRRIALDARLDPVLSRVTFRGTPADAEVLVDGNARGRAPLTLELTAAEHRIELRKEGFLPLQTTVTPAAGLPRTVEYKLTSADRAVALMESAPVIRAASGYELRLVPVGTFAMGSERREQGRRPNEGQRQVTLKRPFYIGVTEVTNAQFRSFRSGHASGFLGTRSLDLDRQPVTQVTWEDAAEFSNWLSEQEGLPPAYEKRDGRYVLRQPVTTGYRLPTEAEWEYAARYAGPGRLQRFAWGDALPVVARAGNIAGTEAAKELETRLDGHRDEHPVAAPVGSFAPNALGLHDFGGNVTEWINDRYLSFVAGAPATDPLGPEQGASHVVRGASWKSASVAELRLAWRDGAEGRSPTIGFRLARYAE